MNKFWIISPIGIGLNTFVDAYPLEDSGCFSDGFCHTLVWDGCIVAHTLNDLPVKIKLFGNKLGDSVYATILRQKLGGNIELVEVEELPSQNPPIDILINTRNGTRTWVSCISTPKLNELSKALNVSKIELPKLIYCDVWCDSTGKNSLTSLIGLSPDLFFINLGDNESLNDALSILGDFKSSSNIIAQVSIKREIEIDKLDLGDLLLDNRKLIITQGHKEVILLQAGGVKIFPVEKVESVFSVGAGAIFSASIINLLFEKNFELDDFEEIIKNAISITRSQLQKEDRDYIIR